MTECIFCTVPDLICKNTPAFVVQAMKAVKAMKAVPEQEQKPTSYLRYSIINISQISSKVEFQKMTVFTPGSRLVLSLEDAAQLIAHRQAWLEITNSSEPHGIIFDNADELTNINLQIRLESLKLPKDWDIIQITYNQYVLGKRAAKILVESTLQFHQPIKELIQSLRILRVFDIKGNLIKSSVR